MTKKTHNKSNKHMQNFKNAEQIRQNQNFLENTYDTCRKITHLFLDGHRKYPIFHFVCAYTNPRNNLFLNLIIILVRPEHVMNHLYYSRLLSTVEELLAMLSSFPLTTASNIRRCSRNPTPAHAHCLMFAPHNSFRGCRTHESKVTKRSI